MCSIQPQRAGGSGSLPIPGTPPRWTPVRPFLLSSLQGSSPAWNTAPAQAWPQRAPGTFPGTISAKASAAQKALPGPDAHKA